MSRVIQWTVTPDSFCNCYPFLLNVNNLVLLEKRLFPNHLLQTVKCGPQAKMLSQLLQIVPFLLHGTGSKTESIPSNCPEALNEHPGLPS